MFASALDIDKIKTFKDTEGAILGEEFKHTGYAGDEPANEHKIGSYFELHIKQGSVLEQKRKPLGLLAPQMAQPGLI